MNEPSKLIYPALSLFLYDVREEFGQSAAEIAGNRYRFWRKVYPELAEPGEETGRVTWSPTALSPFGGSGRADAYWDVYSIDPTIERSKAHDRLTNLALREKPDAPEFNLLWQDYPDGCKPLNPPLMGHYYAYQLGDAYALQLFYAGKLQADNAQLSDELQTLDCLPQLRQELLSILPEDSERDLRDHPGSIGQTWLLWAQLPGNHAAAEQLAQQCCEQLNLPWHPPPQVGRFAGAKVYEIWTPPLDWKDIGTENQHWTLILFPPRQTIVEIEATRTKLNPVLRRLFCHRNRILRAYYRSRQLRQRLQMDYHTLEQLIDQLTGATGVQGELMPLSQLRSQLTQTLGLAQRYAQHLSDLEYQGRRIEIDRANYRKLLAQIANLDRDSQLELFETFEADTAANYQRQIMTDAANFAVGLKLLPEVLAILRSTIDLALVDSGRRSRIALIATGAGLATTHASSILLSHSAGGISTSTPMPSQPIPSPPTPPIAPASQSLPLLTLPIVSGIAIGFSLLFGLSVGFAAWRLMRRFASRL